MIYLDTSAALKALVAEDGTSEVRGLFADGEAMISSRLLAVELHTVVDRRSLSHRAAQEVIDRVALLSLDDDTVDAAIGLHSGLRTLDTLHLAAAEQAGVHVTSMLTYDPELAAAAARAGIPLHPLCAAIVGTESPDHGRTDG